MFQIESVFYAKDMYLRVESAKATPKMVAAPHLEQGKLWLGLFAPII